MRDASGKSGKGKGAGGTRSGPATGLERSKPGAGERKKEGEARLGRWVGQARKRKRRKARPDPRAGLKRKKGRFLKNKSFHISNFQM